MSRKKPFPPYGKKVLASLCNPELLHCFSGCTAYRATIWLATGDAAWNWVKDRPKHLSLVLPTNADPFLYDWRFLVGHDPILILPPDANDINRREQIAAAMLRDGVASVLALSDASPMRYRAA